jgi:putative addiction module component (TIGR02574 family)
MSAVQSFDEMRSWPLEKRLDFLFQMWDDIINGSWHPPLTDELAAELKQRWDAYQANPRDVRTWDEIESRFKRPS